MEVFNAQGAPAASLLFRPGAQQQAMAGTSPTHADPLSASSGPTGTRQQPRRWAMRVSGISAPSDPTVYASAAATTTVEHVPAASPFKPPQQLSAPPPPLSTTNKACLGATSLAGAARTVGISNLLADNNTRSNIANKTNDVFGGLSATDAPASKPLLPFPIPRGPSAAVKDGATAAPTGYSQPPTFIIKPAAATTHSPFSSPLASKALESSGASSSELAPSPSSASAATSRPMRTSAPRCLRKLGPKATELAVPSALAGPTPSAGGALGQESAGLAAASPNGALPQQRRIPREEKDAKHKLVLLLWESLRYQRQQIIQRHSAATSAASSRCHSGGSTPVARWQFRPLPSPSASYTNTPMATSTAGPTTVQSHRQSPPNTHNNTSPVVFAPSTTDASIANGPAAAAAAMVPRVAQPPLLKYSDSIDCLLGENVDASESPQPNTSNGANRPAVSQPPLRRSLDAPLPFSLHPAAPALQAGRTCAFTGIAAPTANEALATAPSSGRPKSPSPQSLRPAAPNGASIINGQAHAQGEEEELGREAMRRMNTGAPSSNYSYVSPSPSDENDDNNAISDGEEPMSGRSAAPHKFSNSNNTKNAHPSGRSAGDNINGPAVLVDAASLSHRPNNATNAANGIHINNNNGAAIAATAAPTASQHASLLAAQEPRRPLAISLSPPAQPLLVPKPSTLPRPDSLSDAAAALRFDAPRTTAVSGIPRAGGYEHQPTPSLRPLLFAPAGAAMPPPFAMPTAAAATIVGEDESFSLPQPTSLDDNPPAMASTTRSHSQMASSTVGFPASASGIGASITANSASSAPSSHATTIAHTTSGRASNSNIATLSPVTIVHTPVASAASAAAARHFPHSAAAANGSSVDRVASGGASAVQQRQFRTPRPSSDSLLVFPATPEGPRGAGAGILMGPRRATATDDEEDEFGSASAAAASRAEAAARQAIRGDVEAVTAQWRAMVAQIDAVWDRIDGDAEEKYAKLKLRITSNLLWERYDGAAGGSVPRSMITPPLSAIRQMNEEHERRLMSLPRGQLFHSADDITASSPCVSSPASPFAPHNNINNTGASTSANDVLSPPSPCALFGEGGRRAAARAHRSTDRILPPSSFEM